MAKPYGKNIDLHREENKRKPNTIIAPKALNDFTRLNNTTQSNKLYQNNLPGATIIKGGTSSSGRFTALNNRVPGYNNPFYLFLLDNAICQIGEKIKPGAATSVKIANPSSDLGGKSLLRKGDTFWIYNRKTYKSVKLTCSSDLRYNDTSVTFDSYTFTSSDNFISGSIVVPDYKAITDRVSNVPLFKQVELNNTSYTNLNTVPLTLLGGEANMLHIPLSCTILLNYGADEMTLADLYIGHNEGSANETTIGYYWASLDRAFYRLRNNVIVELTPYSFSAGSGADFARKPYLSLGDNAVGSSLKLYTTTDFTSASNTLTICLYYKTIAI